MHANKGDSAIETAGRTATIQVVPKGHLDAKSKYLEASLLWCPWNRSLFPRLTFHLSFLFLAQLQFH